MNETIMQKIFSCLWFDSQAEEAVNFYVSILENSRIMAITQYGEAAAKASVRPKGSVLTVIFELDGQEFMALNGGPIFKFSPGISFFVNFETDQEIAELWKKLSKEGGKLLMDLNEYPFSKKFRWLEDRFGVSWQLNLANHIQKITPFLTYVGKQHGKAQEAIGFYISLFKISKIINTERTSKVKKNLKEQSSTPDFHSMVTIIQLWRTAENIRSPSLLPYHSWSTAKHTKR